MIRARFCQLAGELEPGDGAPDQLFMLGLFSVLDALTDTSMYGALANMPLTASMRAALVNHTGAGRLLDCVLAIESGNFDRASEILDGAGEHYLKAVVWSTDAAASLLPA